MLAVDTNVLVRLLARDDAKQAAAADAAIAKGAWVSQLVLAETVWVLDAVYERTPRQLIAALDLLLAHESLVLQDADVVAAALAQFRAKPALGFSDCLVLEIARKAGHLPLATFDKAMGRLAGAQQVQTTR
jgi:predicted nucleic-acid-binding protein